MIMSSIYRAVSRINRSWMRRKYSSLQNFTERDIVKRIRTLHRNAMNPNIAKKERMCINNEVVSIYMNLDEQYKTNYVINTYLKYCLESNHLSQILDISTDIISTGNVSPLLVLNCCKKLIKNHYSETIKIVHHIQKSLDENDNVTVKNSLINVYSLCNDLEHALNVFNSIPINKRDIYTISSMMKCYVNTKRNEKAIELYEEYPSKHSDVSRIVYIKALCNLKQYDKIQRFAENEITNLNAHSIELINTLIDVYGQIGKIKQAWKLFDHLQQQNENKLHVVTVGAMIKCLINNHKNEKAMELFEEYDNLSNDTLKLLFIQACMNTNDDEKCLKFIKSNINSTKNQSIELKNTFIDFFGKIGDVRSAMNIFERIPTHKHDVVTVGSMMKCLINNDKNANAIKIFEQFKGVHNDTSKLLFIKSCSKNGEYDKAHSLIKNEMYKTHSIEYLTTVIDFYGEYGQVDNAWNVFDKISNDKKNIICINSMLTCFVNNDEGKKAIDLYQQFENKHDDTSHTIFIKACIATHNYQQCKNLIDAIQNDMDKHSIQLITSMIDWFGKTANIQNAEMLFNQVSDCRKDVHLIGAVMNAYNNNEEYKKALGLFDAVRNENRIRLHSILYITALHCCGNLLSEKYGLNIISVLQQNENIHIWTDLQVQSAVICFFAKCGRFNEAIAVFKSLGIDVKMRKNKKEINDIPFVYAAIIDCYAKMGDIKQALLLFHELDSIQVSNGIYCIVLNACSQTGFVDEALDIFESIKHKNNGNLDFIHPHVVTAMIDCLGRSNRLNEAQNIYIDYCRRNESIYYKFKITMLLSMFSSCVKHSHQRMAKDFACEIESVQRQNDCNAVSIPTLLARIR